VPRSGDLLDGRYRLGPPLGSGGSSTVFDAVDTVLGRPVAVKAGAPALRREAALLGRLCHPNLVTVHDVGGLDGDSYLVMERVAGRPLSDVLVDGPLPVEQAVALVAEVAGALAYVHAHLVVHGDVKPGNVLVERNGRCRLADFGIARGPRERALERRGTPLYVSPEQLRGKPASPAADVYSLGLVLLTCLTAQPPFPRSGPERTVGRGQSRPTLPTGLPDELHLLLRRMTDPHAGLRPTADQVARSLRTAVLCRSGSLDSPTQTLPGRRVPLLPALAVAVVFLLGFGLVSDPRAAPPLLPAGAATHR
jgi:eukaryotic-like serine/threonine-protein kinase